MTYGLTRTSMALDKATLDALQALAQKWRVSKAEVMRRAVRRLKEEADRTAVRPKPIEALEWLQEGGGLSTEEAEVFREAVRVERHATRQWWES